jgi:hypothetical protein
MLAKAQEWGPLKEAEEAAMIKAYAEVTGG